MVFVDASGLVKRYVREQHGMKVRRLVAAVAVSRLSEVEIPSALARLMRERRWSARSHDRALKAFVTDLAAWHVVEVTMDVTALARRFAAPAQAAGRRCKTASGRKRPARRGCAKPDRYSMSRRLSAPS